MATVILDRQPGLHPQSDLTVPVSHSSQAAFSRATTSSLRAAREKPSSPGTPQRSGEILDLGYLECIDTYSYGGGWLTALEMIARKFWHMNQG